MIERCPGRSFHRKTRIFSRIQKARLYLEGNPQRMLRIEDLMELTRFSSWWLSKTFHAVYQETLQRASMRLRMQRARDLLQNSQLSISELAEACGFHDPCSFARQFKAWHGETASGLAGADTSWLQRPGDSVNRRAAAACALSPRADGPMRPGATGRQAPAPVECLQSAAAWGLHCDAGARALNRIRNFLLRHCGDA